jgi:hypothetical protein
MHGQHLRGNRTKIARWPAAIAKVRLGTLQEQGRSCSRAGVLASPRQEREAERSHEEIERHAGGNREEQTEPEGVEITVRVVHEENERETPENPSRPRRARRKLASESRAAEIRTRLLAWRQTPEPRG